MTTTTVDTPQADTDTENVTTAAASQISLDDARRVLQAEQDAKLRACSAEIQAVLTRYGMRLDVTPAEIVLAVK